MKSLKILIATLLMLFLCMTSYAAFWSTSPPTPTVKWPFDVSKRGSTVNQEFRIREYRSYYFALRFNYVGYDENHRVLKLVCYQSQDSPGIDTSIHIKIYKINTETISPELIYENTILTEKCYSHDFERNQTEGSYLRKIIAINLKPGIYRVEANTIEDRPEFAGTPSYLQIEWHSQIKFLPHSIK